VSATLVTVVAALAAVAVAVGLFWSARERRTTGSDPLTPALVAGGLLTTLLASVDRGSVLSWSFALGTPRTPLVGVGALLGVALLAALAGTLLLGAQRLSGAAQGTRSVGVAILWTAVLVGTIGVAVALARVWLGGASASGAAALVWLAAASSALAATLLEARRPASRPAEVAAGWALLATRVGAALAVLTAVLAGADGVLRQGTYGTNATLAAVSAGLLGLAALEPTHLAFTRRLALLGSLVGVVVSAGR